MKKGFTSWLIIIIGAVAIVAVLAWGIWASQIKREQAATENTAVWDTVISPAPTETPSPTSGEAEDLEKELQEIELGEVEVVIEGLEQL